MANMHTQQQQEQDMQQTQQTQPDVQHTTQKRDHQQQPGRRPSGLTYVASACTNCVRVHAACDRTLPCQRCVRLGRTATCARADKPKQRWTSASARTQRLIDRLADALGADGPSIALRPPTNSGAAPATTAALITTAATTTSALRPAPPSSATPQAATALVVDATGTLLSATGRDPTVFGERCSALVGRNVFTCIAPDDLFMFSHAVNVAPTLPGVVIPLLLRFVNSAAQGFWVELGVTAHDVRSRQVVVSVAAPRTVERDTGDSTAAALTTPTPDAGDGGAGSSNFELGDGPFLGFTYRQTMDGTILDVTDEVEAVLGYKPTMLLGTNMSALLQPSDLPAFADQLSKLVSGEHVRCMGRVRLFAREGELVWVENRLCVVPPATPDGPPSLMCTVVLLSFLQEVGNAGPVECISKVPADVAAVSGIVATVYQQHEVDRTEARLRDASTGAAAAAHSRGMPEPSELELFLTSDMSAETYHRYIGIDAFVDGWMLNQ